MIKAKILHVTPIYFPGIGSGIVNVIENIIPFLNKLGYDNYIVAPNYLRSINRTIKRRKVSFRGYKVYYLDNKINVLTKFNLYYTPELNNFNIKHFDIVHLHDLRTYQNVIMYRKALKENIPYFIHIHGSLSLPGSFYRLVFDRTFSYKILMNANKIIAISEREKLQITRLGIPERKISIIANGINVSKYKKLPVYGKFRKKHSIPIDSTMFLYLGRIHKYKGIDIIVKSFHKALKKGLKNSYLVIAGPDSGYLKHIRNMVSKYEIARRVKIIGPLTEHEKIQAFVDTDLTLSLDINPQPFLLVPLESLAAGSPVVVSDNIYLSYEISKEKIGFVIKNKDTNRLSEIMIQASLNKTILEKMGRKGRIIVLNRYDWSKSVERLAELYEAALS